MAPWLPLRSADPHSIAESRTEDVFNDASVAFGSPNPSLTISDDRMVCRISRFGGRPRVCQMA